MLAFALSVFLFVAWTLLGRALLSLLHPTAEPRRGLLLAPALGSAIHMLPVFWLNRAGIPVRRFGLALFVALIVSACVVLFGRTTLMSDVRRAWPALLLAVFSGALVGTPMFKYGFDWVSVSNDDMANYVLAAQRVYNYGFFESPPQSVLAQNRDISATYRIIHVDQHARCGSELLLGACACIAPLSIHQLFMPVIVALQMALAAAAGGVALSAATMWTPTITAMIVLAFTSLFRLGAVLQLIAQVFGVALLAVAIALVWDVLSSDSRSWRLAAMLMVVVCAMFVVYVEVVPFFVATALLMGFWNIRHRHTTLSSIAKFTAAIVIACTILLNTYAYHLIHFMVLEVADRTTAQSRPYKQFPFFLLPSGLAQLWGFFPLYELPKDPWLSAGIAIGAILLAFAVAACCLECLHGNPSAHATAVMLGCALPLAWVVSDFGLFKLAMFIQPFLIPTMVAAWFRLTGVQPVCIAEG